MIEMKKLSVFLRTGEHKLVEVPVEGDDLKVILDYREISVVLRVKDGDDVIAEWKNWVYWKKAKE